MISNYKFNCTGVNLGIIYFWIYLDFSLIIIFSFENICSFTCYQEKKVKILSVIYIYIFCRKKKACFIFGFICMRMYLFVLVCRCQMREKSISDNTEKDNDTVVNHICALDFEHDEYAMLSTAEQSFHYTNSFYTRNEGLNELINQCDKLASNT